MTDKNQLLQRDRAMFRVMKYFAKWLKVTQGHSKWYHSKAWVRFPIHILYRNTLIIRSTS